MPILSEPHSTSSFREGLLIKIIISSIIIIAFGSLSGLLTQSSVENWYPSLQKPSFNPPNWLFGPVWLVMYFLMGISFGRIWQVLSKSRYPIVKQFARRGIIVFMIHFLINLSWTPVFFGLKSPSWALVLIITLLILIIILIRHFFRLDRVAAFVLVPYLAWVLFATILNVSIVLLN